MKVDVKPYSYKREGGWDFLPQCESWQMDGKKDYSYRHFYSVNLALRAFRWTIGIQIHITKYWKETK